ncbi:hypothetical protein BaRGS_00015076 [Batillaria attramentaria]|uniref:Uncharacterized protein n=1 Tax=Batillaria attramentaria TaxID=370345 RepID=A0ABD0L350_9CAEN
MKTVLVFAALCAVAFCQHHNEHGAAHALIHKEVEALLAAEPSLTEEQCAAKCDALFEMVVDADEAATDATCKTECQQ